MDIIVAAGATRTIQPNETTLVVQNWVMGDGSKLDFAPSVQSWSIVADTVSFGENVTIDGSGKNGNPGSPGAPGQSTRTNGRNGDPGQQGAPGGHGGAGVNFYIIAGLQKVGGVQLIASGGDGGTGGKGGHGGNAGNAYCNGPAGTGGNGGPGGPAGNGGNGRTISFTFRYLTDPPPDQIANAVPVGIEFISNRGHHGSPGYGEAGGNGGSGKHCFPFVYHHGHNGRLGGPGASGQDGSNGSIHVIQESAGTFFKAVDQWKIANSTQFTSGANSQSDS